MTEYFWLALVPPLAGFLFNGLVGKRLPARIVSGVGCAATGASFLFLLSVFAEFIRLPAPEQQIVHRLFTWIQAGTFTAECSFLLDPLSMIMLLVITGVGFLIHVYSTAYMKGETGLYRYFSYLNLFVFMMSLLVMAGNYLLLFVGWEGVGLCSYLLIGYYIERKSAGDAAKKAFVVNRVGDACFLLGVFLIFKTFGTLEFGSLFETVSRTHPQPESGFTVLAAITLLLFLGATGKSAQIPLQVWLPDAMEGPTPVSALIHAATMVTAGVYLVVRSAALYSRAPDVLLLVAIVGVLTALLAALTALVQRDIKKVLAYSTISQLGYMFMALGVGAFSTGIFHLFTHAFFKALLFLGAGSVLLRLHHELDLFRMGGLKNSLKVTCWTMWVGTAALAGIFPLSGFFSKDEILWRALDSPLGHPVFWVAGLVVAGLTAFYMCRLMFLAFYGKAAHGHEESGSEAGTAVTAPLAILAGAAAVAGVAGLPAYLGDHRLDHFLAPVFRFTYDHGVSAGHGASHSLELLAGGAALAVSLLGAALAYRLYAGDRSLPRRLADRLPGLHGTLLQQFRIDQAYSLFVVGGLKALSRRVLWRVVDVGIVDGAVNGTASLFRRWSGVASRMQSGNTRTYAAWIVTGAALVFLYLYSVIG